MDSFDRIWVALDTNKAKALKIAELLGKADLSAVAGLKVNRLIDQEVFRENGEPALLNVLAGYEIPVWVDLKFIDIDRTVEGRMEPYVKSGLVSYVTVMAKGGIDMMKAAVAAGRKSPAGTTKVIAVTELTSLDEAEVELLSGHSPEASVRYLARLATDAGVEHMVCSGREISAIRKRPELNRLNLFVPAVNPEWAPVASGQERTMTIIEALQRGAKAVVVGSLIVNSDDPVGIVKRIQQDIEAA